MYHRLHRQCYNLSHMKMENDHVELKRTLEKNSELLEENNKLLRKIHRNGLVGFWVRVIWYLLIIGLPFALYFYLFEPYFTAMGSSYENFIDGLNELPGFRGIEQLMDGYLQK